MPWYWLSICSACSWWLQLLTQICLALSALILRAVEHRKPIEQLFSSLHQLQSQENGNLAVLEMLTVLPEEVAEDQNRDHNIDAARRSQFTREVWWVLSVSWRLQQFTLSLHVVYVVLFVVQLLSHTPTVLQFLLLQSEQRLDDEIKHHETNRRILRCLLSWVSVHCFFMVLFLLQWRFLWNDHEWS